MRISFASFILLLASTTASTRAQSGGKPVLLPAPTLRPDGGIPDGMGDTGVFLSAKLDRVFAFYRLSGDSASAKARSISVPIQGGVSLDVTSSVTKSAGGFVYTYSVANNPDGKSAIGMFAVHDPDFAPEVSTEAPPGWIVSPGSYGLRWTSTRASSNIAAGTAVTGFRVISRFKPGLIPLYAQPGDSSVEIPKDLPDTVSARLNEVLSQLRDRSAAMIVAPKRPPETPDTVIAHELLSYLRMMVRLRKIDAASGTVRELESALMRSTESGTLDLPSDGLARLGAAATAARERELVDLVAGIFGRR